MKKWEDCLGEKVYERQPNHEKAKSLVKIAELRKKDNDRRNRNDQNAPLIIEAHWEIMKQYLTAILSIEGYKSYSQKCLISYASEFLDLTKQEIELIEELRKLRNDIDYRGKNLGKDYLKRKENMIEKIIEKLKKQN